jgi:serine/threonine protein phosphatase PrpC
MIVQSASKQGMRRTNEDAHSVVLNLNNTKGLAPVNYMAVFDGHGGNQVSHYLADKMRLYFMKKEYYPFRQKYINNVCENLQNMIKNIPQAKNCGSTCAAVLCYEKEKSMYLTVINVGDSRCVLCRNNLGIPLSIDHKPHWIAETRRIEKLGGKIELAYRDDPRIMGLSVSRSFGDISATPYVTHKPEITGYKLTKNDQFIVIGCDGLYETLSNQDVVNFVLENYYDKNNKPIKRINIADMLATHAIKKGSTDNVSVIVAFF